MNEHVLPIKCEICGREGFLIEFQVCLECGRIIGSECRQRKYRKGNPEDPIYPKCKHRLQPKEDKSNKGG